MLRHRLFFGTLMTVVFSVIVVLDGWLDGSLTRSAADDRLPQGTILAILVAGILIVAHREFAKLAAAKKLEVYTLVSLPGSLLLATAWYWPQVINILPALYIPVVIVLAFLGALLCQYIRHGTEGVLANCGASSFELIYLGLLSGFVLAVRVEFGPWAVLTFLYVVKSADIGAYAIGTLFGRHKFSPKVSPSKTWEGMGGAVGVAVAVAVACGVGSGIMDWWLALIFGLCFAVVGQAGDLVESMIKRDARQKDSSNDVPGFGGILDVVDSPLLAAPFAYLFFAALRPGIS